MRIIPALPALIAIAAGLSLTACGNMATNRTLESVNQPIVKRTNYTLDLNSFSGTLPVTEQKRLTEWFDAMQLGYGDRVAIDHGTASESMATVQLVEAIASRHGVGVQPFAPITVGQIAPNTVRIVVTRSTAYVEGCPNWGSSSETNFNNATSTDYGCASNSNLAAMVADPEDLVRGQSAAQLRDTDGSIKAIKSYRDAVPTGEGGLRESPTQGGGAQ